MQKETSEVEQTACYHFNEKEAEIGPEVKDEKQETDTGKIHQALLLKQVEKLLCRYETEKSTRDVLNQLLRDIKEKFIAKPLSEFKSALEENQYSLPELVKHTLLLFVKNEQAALGLEAVTSKQLNSQNILDFIKEGQMYAEKAKSKDITIFVGNTGSGKSTLINALEGCSMTWGRFDPELKKVINEAKTLFDLPAIKKLSIKDLKYLKSRITNWDSDYNTLDDFLLELGKKVEITKEMKILAEQTIKNHIQNNASSLRRVIVVDESAGNKKSITGIGHECKAFTFYPNVVQGEFNWYVDCPGFEDTRSKEIEIANAVNTLQTIAQARSVRVVVLINYYSFKDKRGKGLTDLWNILINLFGHKDNILQYKDSILVAMSQVPEAPLENLPNSLAGIREFMKEKPELIPLIDRIQICDPLDRRVSEGCLSISEFHQQMILMKPIQNPKHVFRTAMSENTGTKLVLFARDAKDEIMKDFRNKDLMSGYQKLNYVMQLTVLKDRGFNEQIELLKAELLHALKSLVENILDAPKDLERLKQCSDQLVVALHFDRILGSDLIKNAYFNTTCILLEQLFKQPIFPEKMIRESVQTLFALMNHFDQPNWQMRVHQLIDKIYYKGNKQSIICLDALSLLEPTLVKKRQKLLEKMNEGFQLIETQRQRLAEQKEEIEKQKSEIAELKQTKAELKQVEQLQQEIVQIIEKLAKQEDAIAKLKQTKADDSAVEALKERVKPLVLKRQHKVEVLQGRLILAADSPLLVGPSLEVKAEERQVLQVLQLLQHVANGEQQEAERLIKRKPELLLCKGYVTDLSKRHFKDITAFQYALWALDWHMWKMLLRYLTQEEAALQWKELEAGGTAHGKHASWLGLIDAYTVYIPLARAASAVVWSGAPLETAKTLWSRQIGGLQTLLPAHVANEYCHESRPFNPLPDFGKGEELSRSRMCQGVDWYDVRCGKEWGHIKSSYNWVYYNSSASIGEAEFDKVAVVSLLETRQRQLASLGETLSGVLARLKGGMT